MNIEIEITDFLKELSDRDNVLTQSDIEKLEEYIEKCNESLRQSQEDGSDILVDDSVYEGLVDLLQEVKPDSYVFSHMWSDEDNVDDLPDTSDEEVDYMRFRHQYPMLSINTIKRLDEAHLREFIDALPYDYGEKFDLFYSMKENGHGVEVVISYGDIYWGGSRARSAVKIKDLTRQFKVILGDHMDTLEDIPLCSIRGEFVLPFANFERAREFNPDIKTAFTGVSSMVKASASDEEIGLLEFVAYGFYADGVEFETMEDMYNFLDSLGFTTPLAYVQQSVTKETLLDCIETIVTDMEEDAKTYEYFTDGVVCSLNDYQTLRELGTNSTGKYLLGNVALKVGHWKQDSYSGIVYDVIWTDGRNKLSPVAIVINKDFDEDDEDFNPYADENKVPTASGNRVSRVPLYEPANILQLGAYKHCTLFFKYGGESGVVPCFANGVPLEKNFVANLLRENY